MTEKLKKWQWNVKEWWLLCILATAENKNDEEQEKTAKTGEKMMERIQIKTARAWTRAQGGMSSDKGRSRGIRGSPQSWLPEPRWRQLSVEAQKMKHHLGPCPPHCLASVFRGLWDSSASEVLNTPTLTSHSTPALHPAIWWLSATLHGWTQQSSVFALY